MIVVSVGLALNWRQNSTIDPLDAILTFAGVLALHASVDLLNDFWDFKRGIDTKTNRTKMSGGTGVLPEGLLKPSSVYRAGIGFFNNWCCNWKLFCSYRWYYYWNNFRICNFIYLFLFN